MVPARSSRGESVDLQRWVEELRRRRVFRALVGYGIAALVVLRASDSLLQAARLPGWILSVEVVVLGLGFPITVALAWVFDLTSGGVERTPAGSGAGGAAMPRGARLAAALVGLGLLAVAPGLVYHFALRGSREGEKTPTATAAAARSPSIAVLPLVNLSSDKEQEYFSDGLAEELLNLLAKVPGLRVAARTSSFSFKGRSENVVEIGQKLNVATVLEGSVRRSGDQIRITTQLINAANGYHLWSETYDRKLTDVFAVQDEIATAVVNALKLELLKAPTSMDRRTANPEAYNHYLLGRQFFFRGNRDGYRRAMQAYEQAVELDPGYAPAWAGLASARYWVADGAESAAAIAAGQGQARAAAEKAVALRPDLADGYLARAFIRAVVQWDWAGAGEDLQRALALAPENADVLLNHANHLRSTGRLEEAVAPLRKAIEIDPLNARSWNSLGAVLVGQGKLGPAREALGRSLEISPEQDFAAAYICVSYLLERRPGEALAISQRSTAELFRLEGAALAHHDLGHAKESQRFLDEMIAKYAHSGAYQIAQVHAWRGETDRAFEWLERGRAQRDGGLGILKVDPLVRGLRSDRRWRPLLQAVNLPAE